jgi:hypothetical protein
MKGTDKMNAKEREELQNPDNWDSENVERHSGTKNRHTVVSVRFPRSDFDKVVSFAEKIGMNVSTFIRYAALEKVEDESSPMAFDANGSRSATSTMHSAPPRVQWGPTESSVWHYRPEVSTTEVPSSRLVSVINNS